MHSIRAPSYSGGSRSSLGGAEVRSLHGGFQTYDPQSALGHVAELLILTYSSTAVDPGVVAVFLCRGPETSVSQFTVNHAWTCCSYSCCSRSEDYHVSAVLHELPCSCSEVDFVVTQRVTQFCSRFVHVAASKTQQKMVDDSTSTYSSMCKTLELLSHSFRSPDHIQLCISFGGRRCTTLDARGTSYRFT